MSNPPIAPSTRFESYMADIVGNLDQIAQNMTPEGSGGENPEGLELYKLKPSTRIESYMADISGKLEEIAQNVTPGGGGGGGGGLPTTGGTMSGAINMDGNAITNLPQASASGDAVSYGQVAQMVANDGWTQVTNWSANHLYIVNNGTTVDLDNPSSTTIDVRYLVTDCAPGDQFKVTATGGGTYRAYSFIDASSNVLSVSTSNAVLTDTIIVAPMGSAKLVVNDKTLSGSVYTGDYLDPDALSLVSGHSTLISSGADLDTLTTAGSYYAPSSSLANSLTHCPVNVGFRLLVVETTATARLDQILIANTNTAAIYKRFFNGTSWGVWQRGMNDTESLSSTGLMATPSNYLEIFETGSFNDAKPNTVIGISTDVPLTDGPDGDAWTGAPGRPRGTIRGTLITTTQANNPNNKYSGLVQMLIGYRNTSYSPTLSYRIATAAEGVYTWSNWSKFEQNGYLHSSNVILYNGTEDGQSTLLLNDLDDAEPNSIYQIDLNCTEGVIAHHPCPGLSSVLMCYAFSYTTRHGLVQTLFNVHNEMFFRYGYLNNTDDYRWTSWVKVNTSVPDAPTTDGNYTLQCTVSNGAATYAWVSAT